MYSTTSLIKKVILSNFVLVSGGEYKRKRSFPDFLSGFIRQELMGREESRITVLKMFTTEYLFFAHYRSLAVTPSDGQGMFLSQCILMQRS